MEKITRICKCYAISLMGFGVLTLLGALLTRLTPFPEEWGFSFVVAAMTLCCLFAGMYMSSCFQKAGLLVGLLSSVALLAFVLLLVGAWFSSFPNLSMLKPAYLIPVGGGIIGGIWGVNIKK